MLRCVVEFNPETIISRVALVGSTVDAVFWLAATQCAARGRRRRIILAHAWRVAIEETVRDATLRAARRDDALRVA
ncbi:hypothetical protein PSP6_740112 [Paraburkholderia tropica]|nr:hypothetical protein PSP6_740112 [Paraburkholderia tropica]